MQELDPPPWLNRMQELGYPPGYLGNAVHFTSLSDIALLILVSFYVVWYSSLCLDLSFFCQFAHTRKMWSFIEFE
jgi:hypothetical protein